jgi:nicotinate phosphoribosyltransferase
MNDRTHSVLLTDLYELTMAAAYFENHFNPTATFELFIRRLPEHRGYFVTAGLEPALEWIESVRFQPQEIDFLRKNSAFRHVSDDFFSYLKTFRFSGEVCAMPEGTVCFANEPILRVTAPLIEAQILETYLLAALSYPTNIASKAARVVQAAEGRDVIEFGGRRAHGPEAGLLAARAAYIGGCAGTSNVEAGRQFGIPISGTMAHSFVMVLDDESEAFTRYSNLFPDNSTLLLDTYDTLAAVDHITDAGLKPTAVRLDSGDLAQLSCEVRHKLDAAGLRKTKILLSGDLDEWKIVEIRERGSFADAYGVGTEMVVPRDAPSLSAVYKLVEVEHQGIKSYRAKFSAEKSTYPGAKQVWRSMNADGSFANDLVALSSENSQEGEPLLVEVSKAGKRIASEPLNAIRQRAQQQVQSLSDKVRGFDHPEEYPVEFSAELKRLQQQLRDQHLRKPDQTHTRQ